MAYVRKTIDVWEIETNYGYGWEVESSYGNYAEAKRDLKEYRLLTTYYGGSCRLVKRRERIL